jgi:hypothetical protein
MPIRERPTIAQMENLLAIMAWDDVNGKLVADMADADLFEGEYREIATRLISWWKLHKEAPKHHTQDQFAEIMEAGDQRGRTFDRLLRGLAMLGQHTNAAYVLGELTKFTRTQKYKLAILQAAEQLERGGGNNLAEVEAILAGILRTREFEFERGLRLDDDLDSFIEWMSTQHSEFKTGITVLDVHHIVPARQELMLFIAGKGKGKSWWLINVAREALLRGKRVLHISLENSAMETRMRYYQCLFAVPKRDDDMRVTELQRNADEVVVDLKFDQVLRASWSLASEELRAELESHIPTKIRACEGLIIQRFPNRTLTIGMLESYLDSLEQVENFVPDLLVIDYARLMKMPKADRRDISIGENLEEVRRIGIERKMAVITADQLTREGHNARKSRSTQVGEAWSQVHTADVTITHSSTDYEQAHGLCRIFVDHARTEEDKIEILLTQNLKTGQFCIDSCRMPENYYDEMLKHDPQDEDNERQERTGEDNERQERTDEGLMLTQQPKQPKPKKQLPKLHSRSRNE